MSTELAKDIVKTIRAVTGSDGPLALHEPTFEKGEEELVLDCVKSGWVSSVGKHVDRLESELASFHNVKSAVAVSNGTAALHISLLLAGVKPGDEVLLPALTFVATANAVSYCGAIPHFVDSEECSFGVDANALSEYLKKIATRSGSVTINRVTGRRIVALLPVHIFGNSADLDPLLEVASKYNLVMVEDAAESLGSLYKGRRTGSFGKLAALSFNGNKIITTGGGGAVLTNDVELGRIAKHLTTTARRPHAWEYFHDAVGFNYRLPNLNAALGVAQLGRIESLIQKKRNLASLYKDRFASVKDVEFVSEPKYGVSNAWLNAILVPPTERDSVLAYCHEQKIMCRPVWRLLSELPMYLECPKMELTAAKRIQSRVINIPSSAHLMR